MIRPVKMQALILQRFWSRWRHEYLTSLRHFHRTTGSNKQVIKKGDVVLVHDDGPRATRKLAIVDNLTEGNDGLVRAASIGTSTGYTNRAIAKLYPLEVSSNETDQGGPRRISGTGEQATAVANSSRRSRSCKAAVSEALKKILEWTRAIRHPPEDVEEL